MDRKKLHYKKIYIINHKNIKYDFKKYIKIIKPLGICCFDQSFQNKFLPACYAIIESYGNIKIIKPLCIIFNICYFLTFQIFIMWIRKNSKFQNQPNANCFVNKTGTITHLYNSM